ncbi:hypothetical protein FHT86_006107 [Rhizobium sp. BK313]|nr:hypothetical protein [Rhizobium sp. BK313]
MVIGRFVSLSRNDRSSANDSTAPLAGSDSQPRIHATFI